MKNAKYMFCLTLILLMAALAACGRMPPPRTAREPQDKPMGGAERGPQPSSSSNEILIDNSQNLRASNSSSFILTSPDVVDGGTLPLEYTCDGVSSTLALAWKGAPAGTAGYAVIMHHVASPEDVHWYWVLYNIPAEVASLSKNSTGIGTLGTNSVNFKAEYTPPCSKGPGSKEYTYTVYALSAQPQFSDPTSPVNRDVLLKAIQNITLASAELHVTFEKASKAGVLDQQASSGVIPPTGGGTPQPNGGGTPPQAAITACNGKKEQEICEFTSQKGTETGVCETVQSQLACSPKRGPSDGGQPGGGGGQQAGNQPQGNGSGYNIEQAISDKAQGMTIAFDGLAFLTGDLGADSFFPPGKVADFWGFQYLRDNDPSQMGHAGDFLTSAAMNMLNNLTASQRAQLIALATKQVNSINDYGYRRFVLMNAFQSLLEGKQPSGKTSLDENAVKAYSAALYQLDGEISYERAQLMGSLIKSMDDNQKAYMDGMVGKGMLKWPVVQEPADVKSLDKSVKVAVMTYAADMFSWYAGSVDADVYFCPERQGTYFGSFYLKDIRAMSDPTYAIPTDMTGNLGDAMLATLNADQAKLVTGLVDIQKPSLLGIVDTRKQITVELRKFLAGGTADKATVLSLMKHYGELDGEIIYNLATNFTKLNQTLSGDQKAKLVAMRQKLLGDLSHPTGAYLYSEPISMPEIPNSDYLFK